MTTNINFEELFTNALRNGESLDEMMQAIAKAANAASAAEAKRKKDEVHWKDGVTELYDIHDRMVDGSATPEDAVTLLFAILYQMDENLRDGFDLLSVDQINKMKTSTVDGVRMTMTMLQRLNKTKDSENPFLALFDDLTIPLTKMNTSAEKAKSTSANDKINNFLRAMDLS